MPRSYFERVSRLLENAYVRPTKSNRPAHEADSPTAGEDGPAELQKATASWEKRMA